MQDRDYAQRTTHLINVALGREKAHLAILNATLANVYTGEFLDNLAICVWDRWIAYVGQHPQRCIGTETKIIDAASRPVIPGLVDGHAHTAMMVTADTFLGAVIPFLRICEQGLVNLKSGPCPLIVS